MQGVRWACRRSPEPLGFARAFADRVAMHRLLLRRHATRWEKKPTREPTIGSHRVQDRPVAFRAHPKAPPMTCKYATSGSPENRQDDSGSPYGSQVCRFESCRAHCRAHFPIHLETPVRAGVSPYPGLCRSSRELRQGTQGVGCRADKETVQRPLKSAWRPTRTTRSATPTGGPNAPAGTLDTFRAMDDLRTLGRRA